MNSKADVEHLQLELGVTKRKPSASPVYPVSYKQLPCRISLSHLVRYDHLGELCLALFAHHPKAKVADRGTSLAFETLEARH